ncbi:PEP-CTERM sorting domain-containing protein [Akkermansia muciniphila]
MPEPGAGILFLGGSFLALSRRRRAGR